MSTLRHNTQAWAKRLLSLSLDDQGRVCPQRVSATLKARLPLSPEGYKKTLEAYRDLVRRHLGQQQAILEHAGTLSSRALSGVQARLKARYPATTPQLVCKPNAALLAGWRLRVGDDVWTYSVADALQAPLPAIRMPSF